MTERTPEEWGRAAVALPGWRWMPGMRDVHPRGGRYSCRSILSDDWWTTHGLPDPDDPATAGCLLALLGVGYAVATSKDEWVSVGSWPTLIGEGPSVGRACIAAAEALGRWPGGEQ